MTSVLSGNTASTARSPCNFVLPYTLSGFVAASGRYGAQAAPSKTKSVDMWIRRAPKSWAASARWRGPSPLMRWASSGSDSARSTAVYAAALMMTSGECVRT